MSVDELILEMQALKAQHPELSIDQVLKIFEIQAMKDLTDTIRRKVING